MRCVVFPSRLDVVVVVVGEGSHVAPVLAGLAGPEGVL